MAEPPPSNNTPERQRATRHSESGNARLIAAREAAIDALASAASGRATIEVRHLQFLVGATEYLNLGDTDPAAAPVSNAD